MQPSDKSLVQAVHFFAGLVIGVTGADLASAGGYLCVLDVNPKTPRPIFYGSIGHVQNPGYMEKTVAERNAWKNALAAKHAALRLRRLVCEGPDRTLRRMGDGINKIGAIIAGDRIVSFDGHYQTSNESIVLLASVHVGLLTPSAAGEIAMSEPTHNSVYRDIAARLDLGLGPFVRTRDSIF